MRPVLAVSLVALVALAVAPVAKADDAAEQKAAVESVVNQWVDAINKGDPKAATSLFMPDGVTIDLFGKHPVGSDTDLLPKLHAQGLKITNMVDDVRSLASGQVLIATGTYTASYTNSPTMKPGETAKGNWMRVLVKDGSDWKVAGLTLTRLVGPPK